VTVPTLPLEVDASGLVGARCLRAVQLLRIGRNPSTVMVLPQYGIWAVSGRGPGVGSNGAGKTVLLGALSLLNGDPQWRGENGIGPYAAKLLFDCKRARLNDATYEDATRGYVIGVFLDSADPADAITVVMRIQRHDSPYVQVRSSPGILLADGSNERDRLTAAELIWEQLRGETSGPKEYATKLYGTAPRCLAYIRARGSEDNQDNGLLALSRRPFRPSDLASQIITLAGKQDAVSYERRLRQELLGEESRLETTKRDYAQQHEREERQLADIASRKRSRDRQIEAAEHWIRFLTVGTLVEQMRHDDLRADLDRQDADIEATRQHIGKLEGQLAALPAIDELARWHSEAKDEVEKIRKVKDTLNQEKGAVQNRVGEVHKALNRLRPQAAQALGLTIADAQAQLTDARDGEIEAAIREHTAVQRHKDGAADLQRLREGRGGLAGEALEALSTEGIAAASLVDLVTLSDDERTAWEARLSPYARAVIVSRDKDFDRACAVLARHPGTPVISVGGAIDELEQTRPHERGTLADLLSELERRMPADREGWVEDQQLQLHIPGAYQVPLTDRNAMIRAAEDELTNLEAQATEAGTALSNSRQRYEAAERHLAAANAAAEIPGNESALARLERRAEELAQEIPQAHIAEDEARGLCDTAETAYHNADTNRTNLIEQIDQLKSGGEDSLTAQMIRVAGLREGARRQAARVDEWKHAAAIADLKQAGQELSETGVIVDERTRDAYFQHARTALRHAVEAVIDTRSDPDLAESTGGPATGPGTYEAYLTSLATLLRQLYRWCESPHAAADNARPFTETAKPVADWLSWYGESDDSDEEEIHVNRASREEELAAFGRQAGDTKQWINSQRELQIQIITRMFQETENRLNELLTTVRQDRVRLRPRFTDVGDATQPLRWELHPQWLPAGGEPTDYTLSPNTAELIILHVLLATSALVAASQTQGRMIILDESGNNLDGPNLNRIADILRKIAQTYGLTVVLACQDLYADRVAVHAAGMIKLLRPQRNDPLNAPPAIIHGPDDPAVLNLLAPYLTLSRSA